MINFPIIALDTEYGKGNCPFLGSSCDTMLKDKLYDLRDKKDFKMFKKICESKLINKVFHSATADIYALSTININVVPPYEDTLIAASLINENFASRKLKDMARKYLDEPCDEERLLSKVRAKLKREAKKLGKEFYYDQIPANVIRPYATKDAIYTIKLWFLFKDVLRKFDKLYQFEKSLIPIIVRMQQNGIVVDRKFVASELKAIDPILEEKLAWLKKKVKDSDYNPDSPKQVGTALKKLGIDILQLTDKGDIATDAKTLNKYKNNEFVRNHLEYKFYKKQKTTYYGPLLNRYTNSKSPIAHFSFWASGAKTGRFSAELIQTIPKMDEDKLVEKSRSIRRAFVPGKGRWLLSLDFAQIEMRIFVHYSKCYSMAKHIINGYDPHIGTAWDIFGKDFIERLEDKKKKFYRRIMKDINFGLIYGMGQRKLISQMGSYDIKLTPIECSEILTKYYAKYPVKQFMSKLTKELYYTGVIKMEIDSPLMKFKREYNVPRELAYKGANVCVQGMSAYILKYAMKRTTKAIAKNKWDVKLIACVHDELVFSISDSEDKNEIITGLKEVMEDRISFDVPILAEAKWSDKSWGDCKSWEK